MMTQYFRMFLRHVTVFINACSSGKLQKGRTLPPPLLTWPRGLEPLPLQIKIRPEALTLFLGGGGGTKSNSHVLLRGNWFGLALLADLAAARVAQPLGSAAGDRGAPGAEVHRDAPRRRQRRGQRTLGCG